MIPVAKPFLGEEEVAAAARAIRSGWITQGPEVEHFEKEFATYVGANFACAVSNCTVALQLALEACGVGENDEVITVSHSFIATANSIKHCGAIPVFVDIDRNTLNISPKLIEQAITKRTKAILCVHQLGRPCDLESIQKIAQKHNLYLIEDAACAIGSEIKIAGKWQKIGSPIGDFACFSMHPRKLLSTGDGGMITTKNPDFDRKLRLLRQHGMTVNDRVRHSSKTLVFEEYETVAYNFRLTDIQAAVGREQLKKIPAMISKRQEQVAIYQDLFRNSPISIPTEDESIRNNWQTYWVRLESKDEQLFVMNNLLENGISSRRGVMNAHSEKAYINTEWRCSNNETSKSCNCLPGKCAKLVESEAATNQCIILPVFHEMTIDQQKLVAKTLLAAVKLFRNKNTII